ncbi:MULTISPECIES: hypothetical protein [Flavobacterium]|uniref:Uncharacterized protein n=1 Tax=Flavobacterium keumense TaxID=1306518 RepID=A0ABY8N6I9_9FLAO|nr:MULTISPECIES: hypothetical protein [Flavobacterium]WGK95152.1 hypothetical protein MG292_02675 [Flavobacterium keumense]
MKNKLFLMLFCLATLTSNCQSKSTDFKCKELFRKYKEKNSASEVDSARYYINSAMKCAPENTNFINNSIQFYIKVADYKAAISQVEKLKGSDGDKSLSFMISVLKLKDGSISAKNDLRKLYEEYKNDKQLSSTNVIYKITLDNYFNNKEFALAQIKKYQKIYNSEYDVQNLEAIKNLIVTLNKEKVLFSLFNIKN